MQQNPWKILNTPEGSDERAIKRAYAKALKALDPDDRNGFIALREAYEAALQEAYWRQTEAEEAAIADDGGEWAAAYAARQETQWDEGEGDMAQIYDEALQAFKWRQEADDAPADDMAQVYDDAPADDEDFISRCWQSWNDSGSDAALLDTLFAQHADLHALSILARLDYSAALIGWFFQNANDTPQSFAWAQEAYSWQSLNDYRLNQLFVRYLMATPPPLAHYPALVRWEENWHKGVWARLAQVIHPGRRRETADQLRRYWQDSQGTGEFSLPSSFYGFLQHDVQEVPSFIGGIIVACIFANILFGIMLHEYRPVITPLLACVGLFSILFVVLNRILIAAAMPAGVLAKRAATFVCAVLLVTAAFLGETAGQGLQWLAANLLLVLGLLCITLFYHYMLARIWYGRRRAFGMVALFLTLCFLLLYLLGFIQRDEEYGIIYNLLLAWSGAGFTASLLSVSAVPDVPRRQYHAMLLQSVFVLPLTAYVCYRIPGGFADGDWLHQGLLPLCVLLPLYGIFACRRWHVALPMLAGIAAFAALSCFPVDVGLFLRGNQILWPVISLAIFATPRYPRLGAILPGVLRSFLQAACYFCLFFVFWQMSWYPALAVSLVFIAYLIWLDANMDSAPY